MNILTLIHHELEATATIVREAMEGAYSLDIPLRTEARSGMNWGSLKLVEYK